MRFDAAGNLYVAQDLASNILIFAPGMTKPNQIVLPSGGGASNLALDSQGNLFAAGGWGFYEYAPGSSTPERTVDECGGQPSCTKIMDLAVDKSGNLYVANVADSAPTNYVAVYAPNATKPSRTITAGVNYPYALAVDSSNNLYVANDGSSGSVTEYSANGTLPIRTIKTNEPAYALLVDPGGSLYVCSYANAFGIAKYPPGATKASLRITKGFNHIVACAWGPPPK